MLFCCGRTVVRYIIRSDQQRENTLKNPEYEHSITTKTVVTIVQNANLPYVVSNRSPCDHERHIQQQLLCSRHARAPDEM